MTTETETFNVAWKRIGREHFVIQYADCETNEALMQIGRWMSDPQLPEFGRRQAKEMAREVLINESRKKLEKLRRTK